jgi:hypothetical protein
MAPGAVGTSAGAGCVAGNDASAASCCCLGALACDRRRHQRSSVSGPPLRVLDVDAISEPSAPAASGGTGAATGMEDEREKDDVHVRVSIMLGALDKRDSFPAVLPIGASLPLACFLFSI